MEHLYRLIVVVGLFIAAFQTANLRCSASIIDTLVGSSKPNTSAAPNSHHDKHAGCILSPAFANQPTFTPFEKFLSKHALTINENNTAIELTKLINVTQQDAQNILRANWTFIRSKYLSANTCPSALKHYHEGPACQFNEVYLLNLTAQFGEQTARMLHFLCLNTPESYLISYSFAWREVRVCLCITIFVFAMALCKILFRLSGLVNFVPDSCLYILLGFVAGFVLKAISLNRMIVNFVFFDGHASTVFFLILLPPIILESAYQMYDREFVKWFTIVMLFAVVATVLNMLIVGPLLYGLNQWGAMGSVPLELSFLCCMTYASIISATDPVAVLAIFSDLGVNSGLYFLVFGEALFNDGIAAVLFNTFHVLMFEQHQITAVHIVVALAKVLLSSIGAVVIGILCGVLTSFLVKFTEHCRVVEPLLFFVLAYASYLLSNLLYLSGIIGIIVCGVTQWHYAARNVSVKSRTTVKYFSRTLASLADSAVFVGFGLLIEEEFVWHTGFVCWTIALIIVARFGIIYGLSAVANSRRVWPLSPRKITYGEQFITAYGGLRGAIAFGLSVQLNPRIVGGYPYYHKHEFNFDTNYELLVSTTMVVVLFTVFVQGITLKPIIFGFLNTKHIFAPAAVEAGSADDVSVHNEMPIYADVTAATEKKSKFLKRMQHWDRRFIKPWVLKKNCYPPIRHPLVDNVPATADAAEDVAPPTRRGSASVTWNTEIGAVPQSSVSVTSFHRARTTNNDVRLTASASQRQLKPLNRTFSVLRDDVEDDSEEETTAREASHELEQLESTVWTEWAGLRRRRRPVHSNIQHQLSPRASNGTDNNFNGAAMEMKISQPNARKLSQMTVLSVSSINSRSRHQKADATGEASDADRQPKLSHSNSASEDGNVLDPTFDPGTDHIGKA